LCTSGILSLSSFQTLDMLSFQLIFITRKHNFFNYKNKLKRPPCPTWSKCYFGQINLHQFVLIGMFFLPWGHGMFWLVKMTSCQFNHWSIRSSLFMVQFKPLVIIMLHFWKWCHVICCKEKLVPIYNCVSMISTCTIHITTYKIYIHDLFKVEPKTSWKHANAFAIKLHNLLLVKVVQLFLKNLLNYEIVEKSQN